MRTAVADWLGRRYPSLAARIDAETGILPLNGSREGLFSSIFPALAGSRSGRPAVLIPNPFYQVYAAAAAAANVEPVFLTPAPGGGYLPGLSALGDDVLQRTVAFYLCSPSNPQGAVASRDYLAEAIALARRFDFLLFADECYSEIYSDDPPPGALETAFALDGTFANVVAFQSLSKRSGLPGFRSGFVAGDPAFMAALARFRNVACPQVPLPIQHVSAALWRDEKHVERGTGGLSAEFRRRGRHFGRALRLSAAKRGLFPLARLRSPWRRRGRGKNPLERGRCQNTAGILSRPAGARAGSILAQTTPGLRSCTTPEPRARLWRESLPVLG